MKDNKNKILLQLKNVSKHFRLNRKNIVKAVDNISFNIYEGETFGLVGESGSGKSTTGRTIIRLENATSGEIIFDGKLISGKMKKSDAKDLCKEIQMIYQDPQASLNPRMTVGNIVAEGLDIHNLATDKEHRMQRVYQLLESVGLNREHANRYPHEFSGGQRQRIGIARAFAIEPKLIIADEPISALDVSIQAQVVNLLNKLKKERNTTYLFIAHDLSMVKYISDRVGVMNKGRIVELADSKELYTNPLHAYTKSLLSAIPHPDPKSERLRTRISYDPSIHNYEVETPEWTEVRDNHFVLASPSEVEVMKKELNAKGVETII